MKNTTSLWEPSSRRPGYFVRVKPTRKAKKEKGEAAAVVELVPKEPRQKARRGCQRSPF